MARVAAATAAPPDQARSPGLGFKTQRVRADTFEPAEDEPEMFWLLDEIVTKSAKLNGTKPTGDIVTMYRKIHMFDIALADGTVLNESARTIPGTSVVTTQLGFGTLGLSICYDVRFPYIYQKNNRISKYFFY